MVRNAILCGLGLALLNCGCPGIQPKTFTLKVAPEAIDDTIPGQNRVLLVTVEEDDPASDAGPVTVTATADGAATTVEHASISAGTVAEVTVTMLPPASAAGGEGWPCSATIRAEREGIMREIEIPITLTSEEADSLGPMAAQMRDRFIRRLAENRLELGIDETTVWKGTIVKPHWLVVSHYLFFSDEWELHVSWHVMIAPYDWARIDLRKRFEETLPSLAYEIPSVSAPGPTVVNEVEPEPTLWR
jgi:hypothetical protein